jgi:hypothetical protein
VCLSRLARKERSEEIFTQTGGCFACKHQKEGKKNKRKKNNESRQGEKFVLL